jgi:membrane-associated phospholipid phosphatase
LRISFLIILTFLSSDIYSQNLDTIYTDTYSFLNTGKNIITAPLSFDTEDFIKLGGVIIAVSGAFLLDNEVKHIANQNINDFNNHFFDIDRYYYVPAGMVISGGVYLYGFFSEDSKIRQLGLDLGEAAFYANTLNVGLKLLSGRSRPLNTDNNNIFNSFKLAPINSAFASGHTTLAFAVSTVMSSYSDNLFWKAGWYTAAGLVGAARIYRRMHWFSDVVLGAAIGYYIGSFVVDNDGEKIELSLLPGGAALRITL